MLSVVDDILVAQEMGMIYLTVNRLRGIKVKKHGVIIGAAILICTTYAQADDVNIAVAANFVAPMQDIAHQFRQKTGHRLIISSGATGKFYAQIKNGAPFAVLLAADSATPERLEREGEAVAGSRFTYAIGRLALWSPQVKYVDAKGQILKTGTFRHLAMANPKVAPYGLAAQQLMQRMGIWPQLQPRIVQGENIAQTQQFVESGNAELGFVAYSQVIHNPKITGTYWLVPASQHQPIVQQAVLLKQGKDNTAAQQFMAFLKSKAATSIIQHYGYDVMS